MTSIQSIENLKDIVTHLLRFDIRTRENDLWLIIKVGERSNYCKRYRLFNGKYAYIFNEHDVLEGNIPRSFMDTIRRTRQKIQEDRPELKPSPTIQTQRKRAEWKMRLNISEV